MARKPARGGACPSAMSDHAMSKNAPVTEVLDQTQADNIDIFHIMIL